ncbi:TagF domain-containing protein [Azonexus sp.]|uniref:TagF domain-containing protein n=1 Tax=Azonexus sp. TaxID=1872668 RepID=UPI00282A5D4E|nr:TagF domain-containing protein [Azonexus sp.]MDR1995535.1 type VI secretion system-associated protein TagF [Azonexus sp.]
MIGRLLPSAPLSPPSVWGKLPAYGDYIMRRANPADIDAWQSWLGAHPLADLEAECDSQRDAGAADRRPGQWVDIEPRPARREKIPLPWHFILPPDTLAATPHLPAGHAIIGVVAASCDRIGRLHPLIVWQALRPSWLLGGDQALQWQTWLAALVARHVPPCSTPEVINPRPFLEQLEAMWAHATPGLGARFGFGRQPLPAGELQRLLQEALPASRDWQKRTADASLSGVRHLPWAEWPGIAMHPAGSADAPGRAYFWQQSAAGEFVGYAAPAIDHERILQ